jgi:hypothetical protein
MRRSGVYYSDRRVQRNQLGLREFWIGIGACEPRWLPGLDDILYLPMPYQRESGPIASAEKWIWLAAMLRMVVFFAANLYSPSRCLFWHDEIGTGFVARLTRLSSMWRELVGGAVLLPVACFTLARAPGGLSGRGDFAARRRR